MNTKKLTEASMLSAAFVVLSVALIGSGMGYFGYIDFAVPVLTVVIYLRCGLKYTILSSITTLLLILFAIGDASSAILMSQSMIYGFICAILIPSKMNIMEDMFWGALSSCIAMLLIDFNFSKLIGTSIVTQCKEAMEGAVQFTSSYFAGYADLSSSYLNTIFYLLIISLPIGTMIITYIFGIILGKKFGFLENEGMKKYKIIKNFKRYGSLILCSRKTVIIALVIILIGNILKIIPIINYVSYFEIFIESIIYVCYFFLIEDSLSVINKGMYILFHSRLAGLCIQMFIFIALINYFKAAFVLITACNLFIDFTFKIKYKAGLYMTQYM